MCPAAVVCRGANEKVNSYIALSNRYHYHLADIYELQSNTIRKLRSKEPGSMVPFACATSYVTGVRIDDARFNHTPIVLDECF